MTLSRSAAVRSSSSARVSASFAAGRGTGARRGVRRGGAGERLGLADRQVAVDHLARQRLRVRRGDEGPGVTGGQAAVAQHGEHRLGQGQQPQQVGDVAAALAERLGQPLLGVAEAVHQLAVALRLLERVEVGALDVLDDRELEHLGVGERRAPPPAARARRRAAPPASAARRRRSRSRRRSTGCGRRISGWITPFSRIEAARSASSFSSKSRPRLVRVGADPVDRHAVGRRRPRRRPAAGASSMVATSASSAERPRPRPLRSMPPPPITPFPPAASGPSGPAARRPAAGRRGCRCWCGRRSAPGPRATAPR